MVAGFRRSISLPRPRASASPARRCPPPDKSYHVRSTSLPCRSHPLISHLENEVRSTWAWQSSGAEHAGPPSAAWLRSGLIRLELLLLALNDLLQLPQTRDSLRRGRSDSSGLAERLLEDFLCFVDAYGSFRSALVCLQELKSAAQVAVRRRDGARLASVARSLMKAEKEVAGLALALREASRLAEPAAALSGSSVAYVELAGVLREVKSATVAVSAAVFHGTAAALSSATSAVAPKSSCWRALRRRLALTPAASNDSKKKISNEKMAEEGEAWVRRASERLGALEEMVVGLESESERVFRNLINTRVSLLNILTP